MSHERNTDDCPVDLIPTRKSLLGRLKDFEDNESWRDFFNTYWRLIYGFATQRGLNHEEAQEVVQETVVAVAKSIGKFNYDPQVCAFKTWLLGVTRSKIANQFTRRARHSLVSSGSADDSSGTGLLERIPDLQGAQWDEVWDAEWQKNLMDAAVQRVKRRVSIEQYQMFDLFVLKQWPAGDVARTLGVTIAHVYVAKHRLSKLIRREFEALEAKGV
jgi:RNA polymerase sigma-70 factor (ECF subfamily)